APVQDARGNGRIVCRPARGGRLDGRDRAALRLPAAGAGADPATLFGRRGRRGARRSGGIAQARRGWTRTSDQGPWGRVRPHGRGLSRALGLRAQRDRRDELSRLFPDRFRLHPVGQGAWHSGRAGARLGRRLARLLRAHHHRSRSHPFRAPVRALSQSRAPVDARFRHRLLPGPARPGDRLRAGALRPRPRGADHHLRHVAGARRIARCRPRAADALRSGRQILQARAAEPAQSRHPRPGDRGRAAPAGGPPPRPPGRARPYDTAKKPEGLHRHASTHAAGIVIGERPLTEMVPLYRDPKSNMPVTQFNMKWVEQAGLVKFDFLGLKTLTVLETAAALLRKRGVEIGLAAIPLDDEKTYAMLARAEAVGIFQLESQGMRRALLDMRPDRFEDIIALVALYRPGPMANIPTYCARKHRMEEPDYIHPKLEP